MSYLAPLRIHFSGRFQAAPSTINNTPSNYDNARFRKEFQQPGHPRAAWNPRGSADWRLVGCRVRSAFRADGTPADPSDPILRLHVADSDRRAPAKLVDLDPDQQLVSVIWGLQVRIADDTGRSKLVGDFAPAPFTDLWPRSTTAGEVGDFTVGAVYQSVLTDLEWDVADSELLAQLKEAASASGELSIRFNVDGYNTESSSPNFTYGRISGTIGAATLGEPRHFVVGRQVMPVPGAAVGVNFCAATVREAERLIMLDLGNALSTARPGGALNKNGILNVGVRSGTSGSTVPLGDVAYEGDSWYESTAGVVALPLTAAQLAAVRTAPLTLTLGGNLVASEAADGRNVRADALVHRLDAGDTVTLDVWASTFGRPEAGALIAAVNDPSGFQGNQANARPAVTFPAVLPPTNGQGRTTLTVRATDPGHQRGVIDGQLYGVRLRFRGAPAAAVTNPWVFVSLLVFDAFTPIPPITWHGHIAPILQQYANLYPVMDNFLDLGDYTSVCGNRELLLLAFDLDTRDPNSMPVTRDLSRAKRAAIRRWLDELGPDGLPVLGPPPPTEPAEPPPILSGAEVPSEPGDRGRRGGKTDASARRIGVRGAAEPGGDS